MSMPTQLDVLLVILGGLLLAAGLLGGGFEMISIKIPKVGGALPRILAGVAGAVCIVLGIGVGSSASPSPSPDPSSPPVTSPATASQVTFLIKDEVGDCQTSDQAPLPQTAEKVAVTIGDAYVGSLFVNRETHPSDEIKVTVPRADVYRYSLTATGDFYYDGNVYEMQGGGQGNLRIAGGMTQEFLVNGSCPATADSGYEVHLDEVALSS